MMCVLEQDSHLPCCPCCSGYQVVVDYVAMTAAGKVFESSIEKGTPYTCEGLGGSLAVHFHFCLSPPVCLCLCICGKGCRVTWRLAWVTCTGQLPSPTSPLAQKAPVLCLCLMSSATATNLANHAAFQRQQLHAALLCHWGAHAVRPLLLRVWHWKVAADGSCRSW